MVVSASTMTTASSESSSPDRPSRFEQELDRVPLALFHVVKSLDNPCPGLAGQCRGLVGAIVGDDDDAEEQRRIIGFKAAPHGGRDAGFLVVGGDHDQEFRAGVIARPAARASWRRSPPAMSPARKGNRAGPPD